MVGAPSPGFTCKMLSSADKLLGHVANGATLAALAAALGLVVRSFAVLDASHRLILSDKGPIGGCRRLQRLSLPDDVL
jgi:hypothetical protein